MQPLAQGPREAFLIGTEFGHLHTPHDASLHLCLPDGVRERALEMGWGVMHPMAGQMIRGLSVPATDFIAFGPRTQDELSVIWGLVQASYAFARAAACNVSLAPSAGTCQWARTRAKERYILAPIPSGMAGAVALSGGYGVLPGSVSGLQDRRHLLYRSHCQQR